MADKPIETEAPQTHPETGIAMSGDWPLNSLMRAEALHEAGETTDPDGIVTDEHIASAGERVAALAKAEEAEEPSLKWNRDRLAAHAEALGVELPAKADKPTILAAIQAHGADEQEG